MNQILLLSGGFGPNWKEAKFVAREAVLLSSLVVFTALSVAAFCTLLLHMEFSWGLLLGSLIASTDAAPVFSILRSRRLSFLAVYLTAGFLSSQGFREVGYD